MTKRATIAIFRADNNNKEDGEIRLYFMVSVRDKKPVGAESEVVRALIEQKHEELRDICVEFSDVEIDPLLWGSRTIEEDFQKFRLAPENLGLRLLDDLAFKLKYQYTIQDFKVPDNKDFLDFIRLARYTGEKIGFNPKPLGQVVVVRYLPLEYSGVARKLIEGWMNKGPEESPYSTVELMDSESGLPSLISLNPSLMKRIYDPGNDESGADTVVTVVINPVITYLQVEAERAVLTVVNTISGKILFQQKLDNKKADLRSLLDEINKIVSGEDFQRDVDSLLPAGEKDLERWKEIWAFRLLSYSDVATANPESVLNEWNKAVFKNPVTLSISGPHNDPDRSDGLDTSISVLQNVMKIFGFRPVGIRAGRLQIKINKSEENMAEADNIMEDAGFADAGGGWVKYIEAHYADSPDEPLWRPVVIDMRPLGAGVLERTFYQASYVPSYEIDSLKIYFDEEITDRVKFLGALKPAVAGAREAETFMGESKGALIKGLHVVDTYNANMTINRNNPDVFFVYDEIVGVDGVVQIFARHETFHSVDYKYEFSSRDEFKDLFQTIKCSNHDFFNFINESYFYEAPMGGHAQENEPEFFATLTNSLLSPYLYERLAYTSPVNRKLYYDSLVVLKELLTDELSGDAPAIKEIDAILHWMQSAVSIWDRDRD